MSWTGHLAGMVEIRIVYTILVKNLKGRDHSEGVGIDGRIILKWILRKMCGKLWTGFIWLRIGTSDGFL
jgi:hypothetical protein